MLFKRKYATEDKNDMFTEQEKQDATEISVQNGFPKEKFFRRLQTCTYDIEPRGNRICIYMSGLTGIKVQFFYLGRAELELIWNIIDSRFRNCEWEDYIKRIIYYVSYTYIKDVLKKKYPSKHKRIMKMMKDIQDASEFVSKYLTYAKEVFFCEAEYDILLELQSIYSRNAKTEKVIIDNLESFLLYDKKQYIYGVQLNKVYVKFCFSEGEKDRFWRNGDGKYYEFQESTIAIDYFDGSGFSFGNINKTFHYFQYGKYGEKLMFVKTLPKEKYYQRDYEYIGKKLEIQKITSLSDVMTVKYILEHMNTDEKMKFFGDDENDSFENAFGTFSRTIEKMKEYNDSGICYEEAISYLISESKKWM